MPPCRPTCVRLDGRWYDLSGWTHPGGQELIARQAGRDVTALFYANHFGNFSSKKALLARLITEGQESDSSLPPLVLQHCSPLYASLKAQVQTHLDKHGLAWRHRFRWEQTAFRFACLFLAWPLKSGGGWAGTAAACAYGLATGRATWTHVHNAVHNPSILPPAARAFFDADYAGVVLSSDVLPRVAPLVRRFASENGLPYHSYSSPLSLLSAHAAFLAKPLRLKP